MGSSPDHHVVDGARTAPQLLRRNSPPTFYRGSGRIDRFRGAGTAAGERAADSRPEDWVASTVTRFGAESAGLTVLDGGALLRDEVRADPLSWLGFTDSRQPELEVPLVKLLDAGQRLPVHVHPSDADARALGVWPQGKAEAWFVLDAPATAVVHLGWTRDVSAGELAGWVEGQHTEAMLGAMQAVRVAPGDCVYVPPGTPHAIGADIFLVEVQQAADVSILLEWKGFFPDASGGLLGLDPATALGCVDLRRLSPGDVEGGIARGALREPPGSRLLPRDSEQFFSATVLCAGARLPAEYRTLIVLSGSGELHAANTLQTAAVPLTAGDTIASPATAGPLTLDGSRDLRVLAFGPRHRGPRLSGRGPAND